jgi:hypothetical protein
MTFCNGINLYFRGREFDSMNIARGGDTQIFYEIPQESNSTNAESID